ncbi:hypothetical protein D3C71_1622610 [compost metagenome]
MPAPLVRMAPSGRASARWAMTSLILTALLTSMGEEKVMKSAWAAAPCSLQVRPGSMVDRAKAARELSDAADRLVVQTRPSSSAPG